MRCRNRSGDRLDLACPQVRRHLEGQRHALSVDAGEALAHARQAREQLLELLLLLQVAQSLVFGEEMLTVT
jgi:hypothetical protein